MELACRGQGKQLPLSFFIKIATYPAFVIKCTYTCDAASLESTMRLRPFYCLIFLWIQTLDDGLGHLGFEKTVHKGQV